MSDVILYGPAFSTYARSVRLALEEKGVDYHLEEVDILSGAHKESAYLAHHPFGKVPAFSHGAVDLYETGTINRYIDESFPGPALQPADAVNRARMNQAIGIVDNYAYPSWITATVIQRIVVPMTGGTPDEEVIAAAQETARTCARQFEKILGDDPYLAGEEISLADLQVIPIYAYFSHTPEGQAALADTPKLRAWWERVAERASVVKTTPQLG